MINSLLEPFGQIYIQRSILEMTLLALLCGTVSVYVTLRGVAFMSHAMSHAVFPGIVIAFLLGGNLFWGGVTAGLLFALAISLTERNERVTHGSALGVLFTGLFAFGIVLISRVKLPTTGGLQNLLFGQLLGISLNDIITTLLVCTLVLAILFVIRKELLFVSFDEKSGRAMGLPVPALNLLFLVLVTLTVVISQPAVGNILIVALLVTPGATARLLTERLGVMIGLAIGLILVAGISGLEISYHLELAPGACIVAALTSLFIVALAYNIVRQLLARSIRFKLASSK